MWQGSHESYIEKKVRRSVSPGGVNVVETWCVSVAAVEQGRIIMERQGRLGCLRWMERLSGRGIGSQGTVKERERGDWPASGVLLKRALLAGSV